MAYKSAAQKHIEDLQAQLLERDRQLAELMNAEAAKTIDESNKKVEAEKAAAIEEQKEKARAAAWRWFNFSTFADKRPNDQPDWTAIDHVPPSGWPSAELESEWSAGHPVAAEAIAAVSRASISDTKLGKMLAELEGNRARLEGI